VSAVIWLGLVVMWAVVLIPMWLRRHDEVEETRSVDKFTSAMHTLSRRESASDQRYVVMPQRSRSVDVHVSGASAPSRRAQRKALAARRKGSRPPLTAAARRRRTLLGLLAVTMVTFVLAMVVGSTVVWGLQVVLDVVLLGFVGHLVYRARRAQAEPAARPMPTPRAKPKPEPALAARRATRAAPAVAYTDDDDVADYAEFRVVAPPARRELLFDQTAVAQSEAEPVASEFVFDQSAEIDLERAEWVAADSAARPEPFIDLPAYEESEPEIEIGGRPWEPVPVPRPTYTTKPTAPPRRPRAPIFEPLLPEVETAAELDPAEDLEEILDRRWAVND
jgi:hypothetical protein